MPRLDSVVQRFTYSKVLERTKEQLDRHLQIKHNLALACEFPVDPLVLEHIAWLEARVDELSSPGPLAQAQSKAAQLALVNHANEYRVVDDFSTTVRLETWEPVQEPTPLPVRKLVRTESFTSEANLKALQATAEEPATPGPESAERQS